MKMFKKLTCKIFLIATFLLVTLPMGAANIDGGGKIEKKVWQDSDPNNKENYFIILIVCLNVLFQVAFCATIFFRGAKVFINRK